MLPYSAQCMLFRGHIMYLDFMSLSFVQILRSCICPTCDCAHLVAASAFVGLRAWRSIVPVLARRRGLVTQRRTGELFKSWLSLQILFASFLEVRG